MNHQPKSTSLLFSSLTLHAAASTCVYLYTFRLYAAAEAVDHAKIALHDDNLVKMQGRPLVISEQYVVFARRRIYDFAPRIP